MSTSRKPVEVKAPVRTRSRPARMGALASLPVFFQLEGRKVLLAGGTDAAAWKAELLAATGAEVHVYAAGDLDPAMEKLLESGSVKGSFVRHDDPWSAKAFEGKALAICDAASDGEAQAFYCSARAAGVPVNVIDNPPFCEFQFGSIVNRSPVVIGISTNGVAPILGQAIRRRIETLLPLSLTGWAGLAGRIREHVLERLAPGPQRRRFWERFTEFAFSEREAPEAEGDMLSLIEASVAPEGRGEGKVTLVGAGPGGAEHLTLKAVRALQAADVILFDDLVADEVLELARREAKRMLVGKRGGRESCLQEDINNLMVDLAHKGKNVVRLKSGDPMVFGRAGEEIARLKSEGIPVAVVPGITSASAMAASLGVSLTHRDHAQAVRFVTGHSRRGDLPDAVDWRALADPATTTVFYMGGRMSARIAERLIGEGRSPQTPVVVMAGITRAGEKRWAGQLGDLADGVQSLKTSEPVLIGIGEVFAQVSAAQMRAIVESADWQDTTAPVPLAANS
ncbi:siroheme synthase CysG [Roseibium sp.]|uniref:siroheme synthase CysG n=1 Tax=Roseibium sp. TaxID=1936156 RepID=UPI003A9867CB